MTVPRVITVTVTEHFGSWQLTFDGGSNIVLLDNDELELTHPGSKYPLTAMTPKAIEIRRAAAVNAYIRSKKGLVGWLLRKDLR